MFFLDILFLFQFCFHIELQMLVYLNTVEMICCRLCAELLFHWKYDHKIYSKCSKYMVAPAFA